MGSCMAGSFTCGIQQGLWATVAAQIMMPCPDRAGFLAQHYTTQGSQSIAQGPYLTATYQSRRSQRSLAYMAHIQNSKPAAAMYPYP